MKGICAVESKSITHNMGEYVNKELATAELCGVKFTLMVLDADNQWARLTWLVDGGEPKDRPCPIRCINASDNLSVTVKMNNKNIHFTELYRGTSLWRIVAE